MNTYIRLKILKKKRINKIEMILNKEKNQKKAKKLINLLVKL